MVPKSTMFLRCIRPWCLQRVVSEISSGEVNRHQRQFRALPVMVALDWQVRHPNSVFSARCNIYISRLCHDASLSICDVCALWSQGVMDRRILAFLDRWMSLLLTDNAWPGSWDGMMPGFLVEEGYGKSVNCSDIAYFTYFLSMDRNHVTYLFISETELLNIKTFNILS